MYPHDVSVFACFWACMLWPMLVTFHIFTTFAPLVNAPNKGPTYLVTVPAYGSVSWLSDTRYTINSLRAL